MNFKHDWGLGRNSSLIHCSQTALALVALSCYNGAMPTLLEAFQLGRDIESFAHSSSCYDARDIGRFWMRYDHPEWVFDLGLEYDRQVNWAGTKDHGLFIAHKVIREFLERAK
jgi:hypothetical protein